MRIYSINEIYPKAISLLKTTKIFNLNEHAKIVSNIIYSTIYYDMNPYLVVENEYVLRVNERSQIIIEYRTRDIDEALYWILSEILWNISCKVINGDNDWKIRDLNRKKLVAKSFEDIDCKYYDWYKRGRNIFNFNSSDFYDS